MTTDVIAILLALIFLCVAAGYRFGVWVCMSQLEPHIKKTLEQRADFRDKYKDSKLRNHLLEQEMKSRVTKLKSKLKKKNKKS
jgi:Tfp pilus assembly protein PilO